jgi:hypothetical protein
MKSFAGSNGNRPGVLMPGFPLVGSRYFQEVAPGVAQDRAEHLSNTHTIETPLRTFDNCLFVAETSPLIPGDVSFKAYAPGVGLVLDDILSLVDRGWRWPN